MADVAQLVRALDCGSGGRGFDPHHSPQIKSPTLCGMFYLGIEYGRFEFTPIGPWVRTVSRQSARTSTEESYARHRVASGSPEVTDPHHSPQ